MAVLPVYNILLAPDSMLCVKSDIYKNAVLKEPHVGDRLTLVVVKDPDSEVHELNSDSFYPVGINGVITDVNSSGFMMIALENRVNIDNVTVHKDKSIDLETRKRPEIEDVDPEEANKRFDQLKEAVNQFSEELNWDRALRPYTEAWRNINEAAVTFSPWLSLDNHERYEILEEDSQQKRFDMLEKIIYENLEIIKVKYKAHSAQETEYQRNYKEAAIRKQMEYLQEELDELHPDNISDVRRLEMKLEESPMNESAKKEGRRVLKRIKGEQMNSAETGMLMDYLETLVGLPWESQKPKEIDLKAAKDVLDEDHYGLKKVKTRIIEQLAVMKLKNEEAGSILLFVGPPGTGKTSVGQSIARALGREYTRISLGGVRDEADIRGHRRTYIGAMPGRIIDSIRKCSSNNPVMVLDEVDKLMQSLNGDPASALLEVLDPEQNVTFTDHYLNVPYDLSNVFFICTANTTETIPDPLLNRMEMIDFRGYTQTEKKEIAKRHLLPKALKATGLQARQLKISDKALDIIISEYTMESGVRGLKKRLDSLCRRAAVKIVEDKNVKTLRVSSKNVRDLIEDHPIHQKFVGDSTRPGVITGLAWTSVGGAILYIETMFTPGKGGITITGQLGDVMKESAQIAVTLVKNMFPGSAKLFKDNDLHIHVPDGATPKDGPSAGITLATALASMVSGKAVSPHVAMTGEISLQGKVNPIGGIPEKLMAAKRSGVKKVFIPKENVEDLKDVAPEVRDELEIIPVTLVKEVFDSLNLR